MDLNNNEILKIFISLFHYSILLSVSTIILFCKDLEILTIFSVITFCILLSNWIYKECILTRYENKKFSLLNHAFTFMSDLDKTKVNHDIITSVTINLIPLGCI